MNVGAGWGRPKWYETDAGTAQRARPGRAGPPVVLIPATPYSSSPRRGIAPPLARIPHSTSGRIDDAGLLLQEDAPARLTTHLLR